MIPAEERLVVMDLSWLIRPELSLSLSPSIRKRRFYHAKYITESIVWHALTAVSKRQIDIVMADYSIYNFSGEW